MDIQSTYDLSIRGHSLNRNKNKSLSGRSKSRVIFKSLGKSLNKLWKCGKVGHYKKDCISKSIERGNGYDDVPSTKGNTSSKEGGDVYLDSSSTHVDHDVWIIDLGDSFHMTLHREWFCEYEKYNGGDIFLGDDLTSEIIG
jgi:hypothetical protein